MNISYVLWNFQQLLKKHTRVEINKDSPGRYSGIGLIGLDLFFYAEMAVG